MCDRNEGGRFCEQNMQMPVATSFVSFHSVSSRLVASEESSYAVRSESWTRTVVNAIKSGRGARAPVTAKYRRRQTCRSTPSSET